MSITGRFVLHPFPDLDLYRLVFGSGPAIADMDPDLWRDA